MSHADLYEQPIFVTRLTPHRSLTPRGVGILLGLFALATAFSSLPFVLAGAWPVAGFMGLDVLLLYLAFRASFRSARAYEDVRLTSLELHLAKVSPRGSRREWRFNASFVRLERQEVEDYGVTRLDLVARERRVEVAGFLGPHAKADFGRALQGALVQARRGPSFS